MVKLLLLCVLLMLSGCQQISEVEFYEPTENNAAYSIKATGTQPGRGPIKLIRGKSGTPDFSDNKSFTLTLFNI